MASNPAPADAANTAVRAFLYKAGARLWGRNYNIKSGEGKEIWKDITENVFGNKCAYCETTDRRLTLDHVDMINRTSLGLHHPGNTVPCCKMCQSRKPEGRKYPSWKEHLLNVCKNRDENDYYKSRFLRIKKHRENGKYALPNLSDNAKEALRIICEKLYLDVKNKCLDSVNLYEKLVLAFVND